MTGAYNMHNQVGRLLSERKLIFEREMVFGKSPFLSIKVALTFFPTFRQHLHSRLLPAPPLDSHRNRRPVPLPVSLTRAIPVNHRETQIFEESSRPFLRDHGQHCVERKQHSGLDFLSDRSIATRH